MARSAAFSLTEAILNCRHIAWTGSLTLALLACSGDDAPNDSSIVPPPFNAAGAAGAPSAPTAGSGGQANPTPVGSGGSTNESGIPVTGGISAGAGGSSSAAPSVDAGAVAPAPDAGGAPPGEPVGGVGPGPSSLPAPLGPSDVARPSGTPNGITTLNWAGFTGAVTYSFDDNNQSQIQNYDTLNNLGVPLTFYLWTGQGSASNAVWARALQDGHEIGNHTLSHNPGTACNAGDVNSATQFIQQNLGVRPQTMAAPNGDQCYRNVANGLFFINRGVSPAQPVTPDGNSDPLNLNCYIPMTGQQAANFNNDVNGARNAGGWVIYVVHGFTGDANAYQPVGIDQMTAAINYTKSLGDMWIGTMVDVGAYWLGQRAFKAATTSQQGDATTYTWQLPGQFPPGKYIRARVDGGTLTQNGQPLIWDPHGYYEIALDAGSVTLTP